ncbi:FAD-dependent oxidoreductase domain-containing 1 [Labeo rohita]|uniref:FAD-dependent oxidoreductase domain-containing protein 1 n=1 Tax=Labeo rohita TaxID=84645 RepID=A0A498NLF8_LABRO|nr:FAD-dependent oxidoreductase domain-containing 1 [Labeo rohita]RXN32606.1 FAD-dependent oxidoreductase domain-containing 1 [Labeo rohita]
MWRKLFTSVPAFRALKAPCRSFTSSSRGAEKDFFKDLDAQVRAFRDKAVAAMPGSDWSPIEMTPGLPPERADVVIVGGGVVGWSIAYWLKRKERVRDGLRVLVVEKDPTNHLSVVNEDPVDLQFNHSGYLFLASEKSAHIMEENYRTQRYAGAKVTLLSPSQLKERYPWMNTDGVALASLGLENEGWFDPWSLLTALRRKAVSMGVHQCFGEVTGFKCAANLAETTDGELLNIQRIKYVNVRMPNSLEYQPVECAIVVNAAGANSGKIASMLGIGLGPKESVSGVPLPVEPRKRFVYVVHCPDGPGLDTPFLIDYSGVYCRREGLGGNYITGMSPEETEEPDISNLDVDHDFFQEKVWHRLAHRVPAFEQLKVSNAWAGFYDYNTLDQNGIIGLHPLVPNMYFATGFSGHGLQQSPAVGLAVAELILEGGYKTIDLSAFDLKRILLHEPILESNIV